MLKGNINVTEAQVEYWIQETSGIIDSYISSLYRTPLKKSKEPNWEDDPITFNEFYPHPIIISSARLAAAAIYDNIIMAGQEPNVSDWGKNVRALAYDVLSQIQAGTIQLQGQEFVGRRFVRQTLLDSPRSALIPNSQPNSRSAGE